MSNPTDIVIGCGGPAGLSAALFSAKNGLKTVVFDTDETWLHKANLFNYLSISFSENDIDYLEEPYESMAISGH